MAIGEAIRRMTINRVCFLVNRNVESVRLCPASMALHDILDEEERMVRGTATIRTKRCGRKIECG